MGYGKYKFCKTRYWKVYGDESVSDAVYNKFISDRAKIKVLLENNSLSELRKVISGYKNKRSICSFFFLANYEW